MKEPINEVYLEELRRRKQVFYDKAGQQAQGHAQDNSKGKALLFFHGGFLNLEEMNQQLKI
jgi:hypothetical protein